MTKLKFNVLLFLFALMAAALVVCAKGVYLPLPGSSGIEVFADEFMWYYLPHGTDGRPEPMEKAAYLKDYDVLYIGPADIKAIYLTFDDCPENGNIPAILDILKEHGAPAAFFMTEDYIKKHPDTVRRIADEGHLVCNHTAHHIGVSQLSFEKLKAELKGVEDAYREATGRELAKYFRPPQGKFSEKSLSYTEYLGYTTVFWSFRYYDWEVYNQPSEQKAFDAIMKETHPGEIVLLHCQSKTNVSVLGRVLSAWEEQGYGFGSLGSIAKKERSVAG